MYRGRFAPSPTGPLHLGSLFTAAVSYLTCLQQAGEWLLRIDDIDPPREMPGAADDIIQRLDKLGFEWSGPVYFQSRRHDAYRAAVAQLRSAGLIYRCVCSRAAIAAHPDSRQGQRYPGTCRKTPAGEAVAALRVRCPTDDIVFDDAFQGPQRTSLNTAPGDYVIWRKDGLPAYHLANVVDDAWLQITDVVRGADLIDSTAAHIHLGERLGHSPPNYGHLPVLVGNDGHKLSKQAGARGIAAGTESAAIIWTLTALGLATQLEADFGLARGQAGPTPNALWKWAAQHWDPAPLGGVHALPADTFGPMAQMD
jgi:glutamyl-Q tRNA(Asp) synthetase